MVMKIPSQAEIEELKKKYVGKRIKVGLYGIVMPQDPHPVPPGTEGTCIMVDGAGQLVMEWDDGSTLSLIPGVDTFEVIVPTKHECHLANLVTNPRPIEDPNGDCVSFLVKCKDCGKEFHEVYSRNEGLWNPKIEEYVTLEP